MISPTRNCIPIALGAAAAVIAGALLWKPIYERWKMHQLLNGTIEERRAAADYLSQGNVRYYAVDLERPPASRTIEGVRKGFVDARMADLEFRSIDMNRESVQVWNDSTWKSYPDWGMNRLRDHIAARLENDGKDPYDFVINLGDCREGVMTFRVRSFPE